MNNVYTLERFLLMTLDPVHVGTGGYRLGRVDLSIVREPGTNLPKIPGTSLHGAIRSYAAMRYEKLQCAGQKGHCGQTTCPICYTFGTVRGMESGKKGNNLDTEGGNAGAISISDARLLLFPVHSMAGPVWITSPMTLADAGVKGETVQDPHKARWSDTVSKRDKLNFGWLMLEREEKWDLSDKTLNGITDDDTPKKFMLNNIPADIRQRTVLVSDKLFTQIVNSNLEVRTSVSINPETGAAEEGALFTYEALPRATLLYCDVVEDDYQHVTDKKAENGTNNAGESLSKTRPRPLDVVRDGLTLVEHLGVGGMGTRGFGRVKVLGSRTIKEE